jgi:hypothetical protein
MEFWKIGKSYLIRTVTMIDVGELVSVTDQELILRHASWIADTGRWMQALREGTLNEVEPFPDGAFVAIGRGSIVDAVEWDLPLPREQK